MVCRTAEGPVHRLWEPLADKQKPVSSYGAKFSLPYSIAVMLVRGRAGLDEFTEAAIRDPIVLELAEKVRYELDPTIDYPRHFSGHVKDHTGRWNRFGRESAPSARRFRRPAAAGRDRREVSRQRAAGFAGAKTSTEIVGSVQTAGADCRQ